MKLNKAVSNIEYKVIAGDLDKEIEEISYDSREIKKNNLFIAITGFETDGHLYIEQAIKNGANSIIVEKELDKYKKGVCYLKVKNSRQAMAEIAKTFFADPLKDIKLVGVTGTNGKTTTSFLLYNIFKDYSDSAALFGTIKNVIADEEVESKRTTPESLDLYRYFYKMKNEGVKYGVMEVSSHALDLYRVQGMNFSAAIFTNLSPEHLDYHKNMDNYREVKSRLFSQLDKNAFAVINKDDNNYNYMQNKSKANNFSYSLEDQSADFYCKDYSFHSQGMSYQTNGFIKEKIKLNLSGVFNIYNSMAAILTARLLGIKIEPIKNTFKSLKSVPGRFEIIDNGQEFQLIVDYAHTPDGMENVLKTAVQMKKKKLIILFGCGGDRDKSKRPEMASLAEKYGDYVIITDDNPRSENSEIIFSEIEAGFTKEFNNYKIIADRKKAIKFAISIAKKDDIVMILGRGDEKYQIIKDKKIELDDRIIAYKALDSRIDRS